MRSRMSKVKVSLTLSEDLLALIDRDARRTGSTRSGVVEDWLRSTASRAAEKAIDDATTAYYASLRGDARADDEAISTAMSRAATDVVYDAPGPRRTRKQR
jgi:metal-responsive CopG/Arc/MetJ family transcriptional regulator